MYIKNKTIIRAVDFPYLARVWQQIIARMQTQIFNDTAPRDLYSSL
jgi:hypothetical protein